MTVVQQATKFSWASYETAIDKDAQLDIHVKKTIDFTDVWYCVFLFN